MLIPTQSLKKLTSPQLRLPICTYQRFSGSDNILDKINCSWDVRKKVFKFRKFLKSRQFFQTGIVEWERKSKQKFFVTPNEGSLRNINKPRQRPFGSSSSSKNKSKTLQFNNHSRPVFFLSLPSLTLFTHSPFNSFQVKRNSHSTEVSGYAASL